MCNKLIPSPPLVGQIVELYEYKELRIPDRNIEGMIAETIIERTLREKNNRAIFLQFAMESESSYDNTIYPVAFVLFEDGRVETVHISAITFTGEYL
jgi:hypothetical protein